MGYEVTFHFREEITKGEFSEEVKTKTMKIGDPYEEVSLEVCAGKVISQLAHPKKLIVDVEIYEYTKKKLSYKETEDGILIKNRKFNFDDGPMVVSSAPAEEDQNAQLLTLLQQNPNLLQQLLNKQTGSLPADKTRPAALSVPTPNGGRVIRREAYDPTIPIEANRGFFTQHKAYPIYEEVSEGKYPQIVKIKYVTVDDRGNRRTVPGEWFVTATTGTLEYQNEMIGSSKPPDIALNYGEVYEEQPLNIRRK